MRTTSDLKLTFLGITPWLKYKTRALTPQDLVAFSGLVSFKKKSVQSLLKQNLQKEGGIERTVKNVLYQSSLRGHASLSTTPVFSFLYESSKFLDSGLTGIRFGSALVSSGRRTSVSQDDIVCPNSILKNKRAKEIYIRASNQNINTANELLSKGIPKDSSSKILQYGLYGTGIIQLPVESIISIKREYEMEKEWMPEEIEFFLQKIEENLKSLGIDLLYATRLAASRNTYPYPNIFKDPNKPNLVRDLIKTIEPKENSRIISANFVNSLSLKDRLTELTQKIKKAVQNKTTLKNKWLDLILDRRQIARDYNGCVDIKILASVAWRVWGEKKRHRTVPMTVESIYWSLKKAGEIFKKYEPQIKTRALNENAIKEISSVFYIPQVLTQNKDFLYRYLNRACNSFKVYYNLVRLGVKKPDALFIIPRGLKLNTLEQYNLYNLIIGYFPLRLCSTAESEIRALTIKQLKTIKKILLDKDMGWLAEHIVPKCYTTGFCPEKKYCPIIKNLVKDYDDDFHQEIRKSIESSIADKSVI